MCRGEAYPENPFHDDRACTPRAFTGSGLGRNLLVGCFFGGFREVIKARDTVQDPQLTQAITVYQGIAATGAVTLKIDSGRSFANFFLNRGVKAVIAESQS